MTRKEWEASVKSRDGLFCKYPGCNRRSQKVVPTIYTQKGKKDFDPSLGIFLCNVHARVYLKQVRSGATCNIGILQSIRMKSDKKQDTTKETSNEAKDSKEEEKVQKVGDGTN